ncbi:TPA: hypothetical protein DEF17_08585, partial [bacterium]|nr:hypothetical protein [bacterium]
MIASGALLLLALTSVLRVGPLPLFEVAPQEENTFYLQRYLVNTADDPKIIFSAFVEDNPLSSIKEDFPLEVNQELRSITVGPISSNNSPGSLFSVRIEIENADKETSAAILPVAVRASVIKKITLKYKSESHPNKIVAAGDFNGWSQDKTPLTDPDGDGEYSAELQLEPGRYSYKFVADGNWITDPSNEQKTPDGFGGFNSLIEIQGRAPAPRIIGREITSETALLEFLPSNIEENNIRNRPTVIFAIAEGSLLPFIQKDNFIEVNLPNSYKDIPVTVYAADNSGNISDPFIFYPKEKDFRWNDAVIYFAFTDRFANGDSSNDSPSIDPLVPLPFNWQGGDLAGIRKKIEEGYFDRLGVNAIWISPFFESSNEIIGDTMPPPRRSTGYHGYGPVSEDVEPRFGTETDLVQLVQSAHQHKIKVLFDMVYNHVHKDHPLVRNHPEMIVPLMLPDGRKNMGLWEEFPLSTWFCDFWPDINYGYPSAVKYQLDMTERWVRKTGVDGFRLDAVKHVPHTFWWALRNRLSKIEAERGEQFYLVGETIDSRRRISEFVSPSGLDGQFDFPLYWAVRECFGKGQDGFDRVESDLSKGEAEYPAGSLNSSLLGNHDFSRFMAFADNAFEGGKDEVELAWNNPPVVRDPSSYEKLKMAWTFLFSINEVPMIYYGDEIGMSGAHDPDNRRMMRFGESV